MSVSDISYPPDHKPGMRVPKGGSSCANCSYLKDAEKRICSSEYFVKWNGSAVIPGPIDEYCSDFWEPAKTKGPADNSRTERRATKMSRAEALRSRRPFSEILDDALEVVE